VDFKTPRAASNDLDDDRYPPALEERAIRW
jgi:hypothetical protein